MCNIDTSKAQLSHDGIVTMHTRVCRLHWNDRLYISSREDSDRIGESIGPLGASTRDLVGSYRVPWKKGSWICKNLLEAEKGISFVRCHGTSSKDTEVSWIVCIVNRSALLLIAIFQLLSNTRCLFNFKWTTTKPVLLSKFLFFHRT